MLRIQSLILSLMLLLFFAIVKTFLFSLEEEIPFF